MNAIVYFNFGCFYNVYKNKIINNECKVSLVNRVNIPNRTEKMR
jgi:hypothetical protein